MIATVLRAAAPAIRIQHGARGRRSTEDRDGTSWCGGGKPLTWRRAPMVPYRPDHGRRRSPAAASPAWRLCSGCARWRATASGCTLIAPDPDFSYRPMAVAEPFAPRPRPPRAAVAVRRGHRRRAGHRRGRRRSTTRPREVRLRDGGTARVRRAAARDGRPRRGRRRGRDDVVARRRPRRLRRPAARHRGGLRQAARDRRAAGRRVAAAGVRARAHDRRRGARDGPRRRAGHGRDARARAAVAVRRGGRRGRRRGAALGRRRSQDRRRRAQRPRRACCSSRAASSSTSSASSRCRASSGPAIEGVPCDEEGFILAGDDGLVEGCQRTWAAGDGVVSPLKFGGLATHQARRAAAAIARLAGAETCPTPASRCCTAGCSSATAGAACARRGDAEGAPLWWPQGKVAGEYLPRWLAEHGSPRRPPRSRPTAGSRSTGRCRAMRGPEAQYLFDLARQFGQRRSGDRGARTPHARAARSLTRALPRRSESRTGAT